MTSKLQPEIRRGPRPGWLGDVVALHGRYYAASWAFPQAFECKVAGEMSDYLARYQENRDLVLAVPGTDGRTAASITLDASNPALDPGQGHIRWFIVSDATRGRGAGRILLREAINFGRDNGLTSLYLTTFRGLDAAAKLYRESGFVIVDEREGRTWGRPVVEQRLELRLIT